jgi:hypothetical protein
MSNGNPSYDITIKNDDFFGSNLNDIQWLAKIISRNNRIIKLHVSHTTNLLNFNKFHYFLQNSFLLSRKFIIYPELKEICIDSCKKFNDECLQILLQVLQRKCMNVEHLHLFRTGISDQSCDRMIKFLSVDLNHNPSVRRHNRHHSAYPKLWDIDLEFCVKITDCGIEKWALFLRSQPGRPFFMKMTARLMLADWIFEEQRLCLSIYPS